VGGGTVRYLVEGDPTNGVRTGEPVVEFRIRSSARRHGRATSQGL
jgi:hypothetical protein